MAGPPPPNLNSTKAPLRGNDTTPAPATASTSTQPAHLRSCNLCRQRKVKCDRRQPCSNCVRAEATCVHPPGAGRAAKRPRQVVDVKVLDRLAQLESTIRRLQQQTKDTHAPPGVVSRDGPLSSPSPPTPVTSRGGGDVTANEGSSPAAVTGTQVTGFGRLLVEESQSRYVSNILWADLTESIEQLRGMFLGDNPADEDPSQLDASPSSHEEGPPVSGSLALDSLGSNAAILGYRSLAHSLRDFHPPVELSVRLFQIFSDNVSPVTRIFHLPTLTRLFWDVVVATDSLDRETEALLLAIYYSAVISLDSNQCLEIVGETRYTTLERLRFAVEQALARANFLNTQSTLLLQAALLYLSVLRSDDGTRIVSSLTALALHVARSMGLHRDGAAFNLSPFETEMRRRIWHQVCLLDHRSTEYHGCESAVVGGTTFDTRWPLNVNDAELSPDMIALPPENDSFTDMTLVHVRCHALRVSWQISEDLKQAPENRCSFQALVKIVDEHDRWNQQYVIRCNPAEPLQYLAKEISYIVAARMRVITYYSELKARDQKEDVGATEGASRAHSYEEPDTKTLREQLFDTAVDVLRRSYNIIRDTRLHHWAWHSHTYIQWQILALVVSEICSRPPSLLCDEAWEYAKAVHDKWLAVQVRDSTERGNVFLKPMGLLMAEAQRVRHAQQAKAREQTQANMAVTESGSWYTSTNRIAYDTPGNRALCTSNATNTKNTGQEPRPELPESMSTTTNPPIGTSSDISMAYSINRFDPFLGVLPDEVQNAWFESIAQGSTIVPRNPNNIMSPTQFFSFP